MTVVEGQAAQFEVSLDQASGKEVTVTYKTGDTDDTAQPPGDYTAVASAALTFDAGDRVKTITVATRNDTLDEEDGETFTVTLSAPGNAALATDGTKATGTISDNDDPPVLSLEDVTVTEGADAEFEVSLDAESEREVTVSYATADDTAEEPDDYTRRERDADIRCRDRAKTITVTTENDTLDEEDTEQFKLTLSNADERHAVRRRGDAAEAGQDQRQRRSTGVVAGGRDGGRGCGRGVRGEPGSGQRACEVTVAYATADDTAVQPDD